MGLEDVQDEALEVGRGIEPPKGWSRWGRTLLNVVTRGGPHPHEAQAVVTSAPPGATIIVCSVCATIPEPVSKR